MEKCNNKQILQMLQELKESINELGDNFPECDNSVEIEDAAKRIESAVLAAAVMIAKPTTPTQAIIEAYSAVDAFQAERKKQLDADLRERLQSRLGWDADSDEYDDEDED